MTDMTKVVKLLIEDAERLQGSGITLNLEEAKKVLEQLQAKPTKPAEFRSTSKD
jgi:hypothetical protein